MVNNLHAHHPMLKLGRTYLERQASSPALYLWEALVTTLFGRVPTLLGIGLRALAYRLILRMDGPAAIESGVRLRFADRIRLIFGWDPVAGRLLALKVLESKETPGLGDAVAADGPASFRARFTGVAVSETTPVKGVKADATPNAPNEVDTVTGATVSSRAVVKIVNGAVRRWAPAVAASREGGR